MAVRKKQIETSDASERLLPREQPEATVRKEVIRVRGDQILHVPFKHCASPHPRFYAKANHRPKGGAIQLRPVINFVARAAGPPGRDPKALFAVPIGDMLIFATLILFSYRNRLNPTVHKRLLIIATVGLSVAAINRWPFLVRHHNGAPYSYIFLFMIAVYDLWSTHHVYASTIWGSAFLIAIQQICGPIGRTSAWLHFAAWLQSLVR